MYFNDGNGCAKSEAGMKSDGISLLEASEILMETFSTEYGKLLSTALVDQGKLTDSLGTVQNENFFFSLFSLDSYLNGLKCDESMRAKLFNELVDNYYRKNQISNRETMDLLVNNRLKQYSKAFNLSPPSNIKEIMSIHGQLIAKASLHGSNELYIHGESAVETDLMLIALINGIDTILIEKLYAALRMLKEVLSANSAPQSNSVGRSLNAHFCHNGLPSVLFKSKDSVLNQFLAYPEQTVTKLWQFCATTLKMQLDSPIYTTVHKAKNAKIVFINMPKPKRPTDCYYCAIVFHYEKRLMFTNIQKIAYYTLEHGIDIINNKALYFVCRWENESKHVNLGQQVDYNAGKFHQSVRQMELL